MRPKQHLSEQRPGAVTLMEKRAHSDRCEILPAALPDDMGKKNSILYRSYAYGWCQRSYDRGKELRFITELPSSLTFESSNIGQRQRTGRSILV